MGLTGVFFQNADAASVSVEWGLRFCISNPLPGEVRAAGLTTMFGAAGVCRLYIFGAFPRWGVAVWACRWSPCCPDQLLADVLLHQEEPYHLLLICESKMSDWAIS